MFKAFYVSFRSLVFKVKARNDVNTQLIHTSLKLLNITIEVEETFGHAERRSHIELSKGNFDCISIKDISYLSKVKKLTEHIPFFIK